jgi:hypothetical protein
MVILSTSFHQCLVLSKDFRAIGFGFVLRTTRRFSREDDINAIAVSAGFPADHGTLMAEIQSFLRRRILNDM